MRVARFAFGVLAEILLPARIVETQSVLEEQNALAAHAANLGTTLAGTDAAGIEAGDVAEEIDGAVRELGANRRRVEDGDGLRRLERRALAASGGDGDRGERTRLARAIGGLPDLRLRDRDGRDRKECDEVYGARHCESLQRLMARRPARHQRGMLMRRREFAAIRTGVPVELPRRQLCPQLCPPFSFPREARHPAQTALGSLPPSSRACASWFRGATRRCAR